MSPLGNLTKRSPPSSKRVPWIANTADGERQLERFAANRNIALSLVSSRNRPYGGKGNYAYCNAKCDCPPLRLIRTLERVWSVPLSQSRHRVGQVQTGPRSEKQGHLHKLQRWGTGCRLRKAEPHNCLTAAPKQHQIQIRYILQLWRRLSSTPLTSFPAQGRGHALPSWPGRWPWWR